MQKAGYTDIFPRRPRARRRAGFSLIEVMVAVALFGLVVGGMIEVYIMCQKYWQASTLQMQMTQMADMSLLKMVFGTGTNSGLRQASSIRLDQYPETVANSAYVHDHLNPSTYKYWEQPDLSPPTSPDTRLDMTCSYPTTYDGGSWRLMFSNQFAGVQYIEYNCPFRTISLGTSSVSRVVLATYVRSAVVTTNNQGLNIQVTTWRQIGNFIGSNTASAFVLLRNINSIGE